MIQDNLDERWIAFVAGYCSGFISALVGLLVSVITVSWLVSIL